MPRQDPTLAAATRGTWLTGGHDVMQAISQTDALSKRLRRAVSMATKAGTTSNRGIGEVVEKKLAPMLTEKVQREIAEEAIAALPSSVPSFGAIRSITWEETEGARHIADFVVTVSGSNRKSALPFNLKTQAPSWDSVSHRACSVSAVIRVALGMQLAGPMPPKADQIALELLAGTRRVHSASTDYFIVCAHLDKQGKLNRVTSQGMLSVVEEDGTGGHRYPWRRNRVRPDDVEFSHRDLVLPPDFDVNRNLGLALLPNPARPLIIEALTVSKAHADGATADELSIMARTLLEAADG